MVYGTVAVVVLVLVCGGWKLTSRGGYETAEYTLLRSDGAFETRHYPALTLATTNARMESQGDDGSFMRLFRYISGANDDQRKVAMTTPVFIQADPAEGRMGFVIPRQVVEQGVPEPADESVEIQNRSGGKYAVYRFNGRVSKDKFAVAEAKLRDWMQAAGYHDDEGAEFAGYDPPWTPGPFRRNEVLIPISDIDSGST